VSSIYNLGVLNLESSDWKLVNDDGSIWYESEEADKLLAVIKNALEPGR